MGILTDPEISWRDREAICLSVLHLGGESPSLGLGWHVLHSQTNKLSDLGGQAEKAFFAQYPWKTLPGDQTGIMALRERLTIQYLSFLCSDLGSLERKLKLAIATKESSVRRSGPTSTSLKDQRRYVDTTLRRFARLIEAGLEGEYLHRDFSDFFVHDKNRLRRTIVEVSEAFAVQMRTEGRNFDGSQSAPKSPIRFSLGESGSKERDFSVQYLEKVAKIMRVGRGNAVPGQLPSAVLTTVFREQSEPWEQICQDYVSQCATQARVFLEAAITHVCSDHTAQQQLKQHIYPALDARTSQLESKLRELLWPYQSSHPTTYSRVLQTHLERIQSVTFLQHGDGLPDEVRWTVNARRVKLDDDLVAAAEVADRAEAYYQVALEALVDQVALLGVEACLLHDLPNIIPGDIIYDLSDEQISVLAAEPANASEQRDRLQRQSEVLREAAKIFQKYAHYTPEPREDGTGLPFRPQAFTDQPPSYQEANGHQSTRASTGSSSQPRSNTSGQPHFAGSFGTNSGTGSPGLFGAANNHNNSGFGSGSFGQPSNQSNSAGLFGGSNSQSNGGGLFGSSNTGRNNGSGLFGASSNKTSSNNSNRGFRGFGRTATPSSSTSGFGSTQQNTPGLFGRAGGGFGSHGSSAPGSSLFGNTQSNGSGLFGARGG